MRTIIGITTAGFIAMAIGVWLSAASHSAAHSTVAKATIVPSLATAINIMEMHNRAHLENLPVGEVEDQSLIFNREPHN
jgi:hypothetical protein